MYVLRPLCPSAARQPLAAAPLLSRACKGFGPCRLLHYVLPPALWVRTTPVSAAGASGPAARLPRRALRPSASTERGEHLGGQPPRHAGQSDRVVRVAARDPAIKRDAPPQAAGKTRSCSSPSRQSTRWQLTPPQKTVHAPQINARPHPILPIQGSPAIGWQLSGRIRSARP